MANLKFKRAFEEEEIIKDIVSKLGWDYINSEQVRCVYSEKSTSRALARIWSTPRIFSYAFGTKPLYVIELLKHKFHKLSEEEKIKVLIHELLHIPKTFSGALTPHVKMGKTIACKSLDKLFHQYVQQLSEEERTKFNKSFLNKLFRL
ncbi:MAG: metallopeptidase [Nanoarchaeota archaeon]|nr:metallopeptidase [Nanoarchaeota archaeon]